MEIAEGTQSQETPGAGVMGGMESAAEKYVPQSEVNKVVGREKQEAYQRGRQEALADLQKTQSSSMNSEAPQGGQNAGMGGVQPLGQDDARRIYAEEFHKQNQLTQANQIVADFTKKLDAGKSKYPDIESTVASLNLAQNPHIVQWSHELGIDNIADVVHEFKENPSKYANLLTLSYAAPAAGKDALKKLSDSIKQNETATANAPSINEPLSQIKPSPIGTDTGKRTIRDLRKKYRA